MILRAAALWALGASAVAAQDADCVRTPTQFDINVCAGRAAQAADDELNRLWKIVKPRADARGEGQALLEAQRAWLKYRDATCEMERASYGAGSMAPAAFAMCIERLTLERNAALRVLQ